MSNGYIILIVLSVSFIIWVVASDFLEREKKKNEMERLLKRRAQEQAERILRQQAQEQAETCFIGNFGVRITPCVKRSGNEFWMKHGTQYKIEFVNKYDRRANVTVYVDGKHIGTFRLLSDSKSSIEHPANDNSCFTFYKLESKEAKQFDLFEDNDKLGEITCIFVPEKEEPDIRFCLAKNPDIRWKVDDTPSRGGTGLSGYSNQEYSVAEKIKLDFRKKKVITIKLLCFNDEPHKISPVKFAKQDDIDSASAEELTHITIVAMTYKEVIEKIILQSYKSPTEFLYLFLSVSRMNLLKKKYPVRIVDISQKAVVNILAKYNLKMSILLSRYKFYRDMQQNDNANFLRNAVDVIKTSQYYDYGDEIDLLQVRTNALKIVTNCGFGVLDETKAQNTFLSTYRHSLEAFEELIPDFEEKG